MELMVFVVWFMSVDCWWSGGVVVCGVMSVKVRLLMLGRSGFGL